MRLLQAIVSVGLVVTTLSGCGDDAEPDSPAGGAPKPSDCDAVGRQQQALISAAGCSDNSATIVAGCRALYSSKMCVAEWESLITCISAREDSDFECDSDDELAPKAGVCTAERAAFDGCIG